MSETEFRDPAELPQASFVDSPESHFLEAHCPQCRHEVDAVCPICSFHVEQSGACSNTVTSGLSDKYRRILLLIQNSRNAKFTLHCLLIATGDAYADGLSMTEVARMWSTVRANVSKHCREICRELEIQPSAYMMNEEAAGKFRLANRRPVKVV